MGVVGGADGSLCGVCVWVREVEVAGRRPAPQQGLRAPAPAHETLSRGSAGCERHPDPALLGATPSASSHPAPPPQHP